MTAKDMVHKWLDERHYDGLFCGNECGCQLSALIPCQQDFSKCEPGYKVPCIPDECNADGDCPFHISAEKSKGEKKDVLSHGTAIIEVGRCEQPTDDHECPEAVNSQGSACKCCDVSSCYRKGWEKIAVDADNTRRCITKGETNARQ